MELREGKKEWRESGLVMSRESWKKAANKLHLQFKHASKEKLKTGGRGLLRER